MPELPEVETTKASLDPLLGQAVSGVQIHHHKLRYPIPDDLGSLVGFVLQSVERRAKYLLLHFYHQPDNRRKVLLIHLGMSGSLQQHTHHELRKHDHLVLEFGDVWLHYHDPRRFGMILWVENDDYIDTPDTHERFLTHLGPEPLSDAFDDGYLHRVIFKNFKNKAIAKPIKSLIMEQSVVVGVGNIYAAESLFLSRIHPATPANHLDANQLATLTQHIKAILARAIKQGGSTLRDFTVGSGKTGYFQQTLLVYGRDGQPCTECGTVLENQKIAGRASVYCPHCQPLMP
ncbi:bifunctional DNA-formamidopyrimidine glycosylase/DNA-(apurinic or apyrimidinic site) lyase [Moraxella nasibovis]|uniref:bifunctional DNA-formamidopyrimidine glycosylase/DNA-(apurinic or apyrimidinic site) lyase n=1 Tax=Moraxella nasibovis TaxID=2904120 RepID=UPI00240E9DD7|nr:bifunctional DNA-formamidopyrimidine glycosylase/DNA-(apurinic or apyrimidinic site) lyase [Moraxella nasibovis]WFF38538.1 bifunctional DNA-formamidopyrimidine glycosylase/DNA-(apurinic or apyrimidinic site) lyase [Moraxella nasibovis]